MIDCFRFPESRNIATVKNEIRAWIQKLHFRHRADKAPVPLPHELIALDVGTM